VVAEALALVKSGVREINLIAQDLTAYGRDLTPAASLAQLLEALDGIKDLRWIRLLYCYPNSVSQPLLEAVAHLTKVVKYIDMPLQHGDDDVLRAMRRERSGAGLSALLERIRRQIPGVVLRTSFIVGFPGETETAFERLKDFVYREQFDRLGVFAYSREEDTAAAEMPGQVPEQVKRQRRRELMQLQAEISLRKNRGLIGQEVEVLVEGELPGRAMRQRGRSSAQAPEIDGMVMLRGEAQPGEFVRVRINEARTYDLVGDITGASG
jgi:ribosomal protein S12 methylthiotransferase